MLLCLLLPFLISTVYGEEECLMKADFVFVIDSSSSIWGPDFESQIEFVKNFVERFNVGPDETRVAALTFGHDVWDQFYLNKYGNEDDILTAISKIKHMKGKSTNTHLALEATVDRYFAKQNGARPDVAHIAIVLTDGKSTEKSDMLEQARRVKGAGILVFGIGIGDKVNATELGEMVTHSKNPKEKYMFLVKSFDELKKDTFQEILEKRTCEVITTPKPVITTPNPIIKDEPVPDCQGKSADIVFVLDKSSSISTEEAFDLQRQFVKHVVDIFDIDSGKTQVGLISFSDAAQIEFKLNEYSSKAGLDTAIQNVKFTGGNTNTGYALQLLMDEMFTKKGGIRKGTPQIAIVITDGMSQQPMITKNVAEKVHAKGIFTFAIGVGKDVDDNELTAIASTPTEDYKHTVNSYAALDTIKNILTFKACENKAPPKPTLPPPTTPVPNDKWTKICKQHPVDLVFVLDKSSSIYILNFVEQLEFVNDLIQYFTIGPGQSRVAMVTWSTDSKVEFNLDNKYDKATLENAVRNVNHTGGVTNTWKALKTLLDDVYSRRRSGIPFDVVMITDGRSQDTKKTEEFANNVHKNKIKTFAVGVGDEIDKAELASIASKPSSKYVHQVADYGSLEKIRDDLLDETCTDVRV